MLIKLITAALCAGRANLTRLQPTHRTRGQARLVTGRHADRYAAFDRPTYLRRGIPIDASGRI